MMIDISSLKSSRNNLVAYENNLRVFLRNNQITLTLKKISGQGQTDLTLEKDISKLEAIVEQLESEVTNVASNAFYQLLSRVTIDFLQITNSLAETKIQILRPNQNLIISNLHSKQQGREEYHLANTHSVVEYFLQF